MFCSLFEGELLGFLRRSVKAMGCFFGCFRIRDDDLHPQPRLVSEPLPSKHRGPVVSRNRLSSLLLAEDKDGSLHDDKENFVLKAPEHENDDKELKDEARFLKACGTLPETPSEFRKASRKIEDASCVDGHSEPSKFHSWLPNTSTEKLKLGKQQDQPPTPIKFSENWTKGSESLLHTPVSCVSNEQDAGRISSSPTQGCALGSVTSQPSSTAASSITDGNLASNVQLRNKAVHFECEDDVTSFSSGSSSSEISSQNIKQTHQSAGTYNILKASPYPTPLKLTDEMQTPGTVFPAYIMANTRNPRVRSQYVYAALNPVGTYSQWEALKEEDSDNLQLSESFVSADNAIPASEVHAEGQSVEKELKVEASLSSWMKPPLTNEDGNNLHPDSILMGARVRKTPGDRPIIGMVAAHWNEDEASRVSPKYWDGNGIPNSTNKYKEDQKVSWHATPFEERLEKALSDETSIPGRKRMNGTPPAFFGETEESDTALSELQSSTHIKPVVSF